MTKERWRLSVKGEVTKKELAAARSEKSVRETKERRRLGSEPLSNEDKE